jgi:tripartite-type tricarboxylate transporter receptor subunit TctC
MGFAILRVWGLAGAVLAAFLSAVQAQAQNYPNRTVTLVVPFSAGGTADLLARYTADKLRTSLGQQVIVENRAGGAGGLVGTEFVFKAAADGYTLLCAPQLTFTVSHLLFRKLLFDPRLFEPVSVLATYPIVLFGRADLPVNNLSELIAYARSNPGKITLGHQGQGQTGHLVAELLMLKGNVQMLQVPYRGSAPAINDLLAGQIDVVPDYLLSNKGHVDAGKLKLLAVGARERLKDYPTVPTFDETFPGIYPDTWMAIVAPPGTPKDITQKISGAIGQAFQTADLRARVESLQAEPLGGTPEQMRVLIDASTQQWAPVIEAAKIVVE